MIKHSRERSTQPVITKSGINIIQGFGSVSWCFSTGSLTFLASLSTRANVRSSFCLALEKRTVKSRSLSCKPFLGTCMSISNWVAGQSITTSWCITLKLSTSSMTSRVKKPGQVVRSPPILAFQLVFARVKLLLNVSSLRIVALVRTCLRIDSFSEMVTVIIGDRWEFCKRYANSPWDWTPRCSTFAGIHFEIGPRMVFDQSERLWQLPPSLQVLVVIENGVLVRISIVPASLALAKVMFSPSKLATVYSYGLFSVSLWARR